MTMTRSWRCGHPRTPENTRSDRCRACLNAATCRYNGSEKGRARNARYDDTPAGRARKLMYESTIRSMMRAPRPQFRFAPLWPGWLGNVPVIEVTRELCPLLGGRSDFSIRADYAAQIRDEARAGLTSPRTLGQLLQRA